MKRSFINKVVALSLVLTGLAAATYAQEKEKPKLLVSLSYQVTNNTIPTIKVTTKTKADGKVQTVSGMEVKLYLDKDSTGKGLGFIGKVVTNEKGVASTTINPSLAPVWKVNPNHTFIAITDKTKQFDETNNELSITKARITVDTAEDKNVVATVEEFKGGAWVPVKGVELKLGIARTDADLPISDKDSYTTDSLGKAKGEFKRDSLPGDLKGNIVLVARVDDNDQYGNLRVEKSVKWGRAFAVESNFGERALWAPHLKTPFWLLFMAYSIVFTVWGVLIYLVILMFKIKKLGRQEA